MTAPDLPIRTDVARFTRAAVTSPLPVSTTKSLIPGRVFDGHRWEIADDGRIVGIRRSGGAGRELSPDLVAGFCRDHRIGVTDDVFGSLLTDRPEFAREVADQVAAMVRRAAARDQRTTVLTLEAAVAGRLATSRALSIDRNGALWWRWAAPVDPVLGRGMPGQPAAPDPGPARAPAGLLAGFRRRSDDDGTLVTAAVVEVAVRDGRLLQRFEPVPDWSAVVAELYRLAGAPAPDASGDAGPATRWLRGKAANTDQS